MRKASHAKLLTEAKAGLVHYPAMITSSRYQTADTAFRDKLFGAVLACDLLHFVGKCGSLEGISVDRAAAVLIANPADTIRYWDEMPYAEFLSKVADAKTQLSKAVCIAALDFPKTHDALSRLLRNFYSADAAHYLVLETALLKAIVLDGIVLRRP